MRVVDFNVPDATMRSVFELETPRLVRVLSEARKRVLGSGLGCMEAWKQQRCSLMICYELASKETLHSSGFARLVSDIGACYK
ncbi:hypothetical protein RHGRI_007782 [Rhododendron griersonianum]|uniref:Uncharacterized protein n=1 Tax=Rhododendron griersonianum TaxID=479676 RepID=A0AAV6KY70_9ERIC|nr:hypothetical protein RHGRI_007782 [Rhododendron griersonianum]